MKLKINRQPIYGLTIKTGKIETFRHKEEAIKFLTGDKPSSKKASPKPTPKTVKIKKGNSQPTRESLEMPSSYPLESGEAETSLSAPTENNS